MCRCTWMHSRAVLCCVLLSPLQIMIKVNLFCVLGRLQGHRCQLCQTWLRRYWIILCFEHVLWIPCRCNTFDGRLLWFDGVEGKSGLTLTGFIFFIFFLGGGFVGAGGVVGQTVWLYSAYWCSWHTMRLTSFRHYYFPQVLSMVM